MSEHVISRTTYLIVFAALMVLLVATFAVEEFVPGPAGFVVSLGIAVAKAVLIGIYFMHLRFSSPLSRLVAAGGVLWLGILLSFTLRDYGHRAGIEPSVGPGWTEATGAVRGTETSAPVP